jgi:hypothetical protein
LNIEVFGDGDDAVDLPMDFIAAGLQRLAPQHHAEKVTPLLLLLTLALSDQSRVF